MQKFNTLKLMRKRSSADTKKKPVLHPVQVFQASANKSESDNSDDNWPCTK